MPASGAMRKAVKESVESAESGKYEYWSPGNIISVLKDERPEAADMIRDGIECIVIPTEDGRETVAAYRYTERVSGVKARQTFYRHRIFSALCPHNFPRFHAAIGAADGAVPSVTGTIRQRIIGTTRSWPIAYSRAKEAKSVVGKAAGMALDALTKGRHPAYPISAVRKAAVEMGIGEFFLDANSNNYMLGADGGEYFVDTLHEFDLPSHRAEIMAYMEAHDYAPEEKEVVRLSLDRLAALARQNPS